jgi:DNA-binding NarL/FixJ family response regulator
MDERPVRVLTVDDQAVFRRTARALVGRTPGFELVGESPDGETALRLARDADPDIVLLDLRMTGIDGIETARRLSAEDPTRVIVLASSADVRDVADLAASAGAAAVICKQWLSPRLLRGLWIALRRR